MITEYHRPETLEEALKLLARSQPITVPMGGGVLLNQPDDRPLAVVDLQSLGLDTIQPRGNSLVVGAAVTLQSLLDMPGLPPAIYGAVQRQAARNIRQAATLGGLIAAADGRSPLLTALLALDIQLELVSQQAGIQSMGLGDLLPLRPSRLWGSLITHVHVPLNAGLAYHDVARTPADLPIVCAAAARWSSGRSRLALGGFGVAPVLALDGPEPSGFEAAASSCYAQAGDEWASASYRQEIAAVLALRCHETLALTASAYS